MYSTALLLEKVEKHNLLNIINKSNKRGRKSMNVNAQEEKKGNNRSYAN
jgi:hypothetical protein